MRNLLLILLVVAVPVAACNKSGDPTPAPAAAPLPAAPAAPPAATAPVAAAAPVAAGGDPECLVGTWANKIGDKNVYTFNADKTGDRKYVADPKVGGAFTWSMKDPKVALVVFPEHGDHKRAEFEFTVDCSLPQIKFQDQLPFAKL